MKKLSLWIAMLLIMGLAACSGSTAPQGNGEKKITVAVGIVPEATFVKKVGGDLVNVVTLIPPGNNPENYQPTVQVMKQLSDASLYFSLQLPTEQVSILPKIKDFSRNIEVVNLQEATASVYELLPSDHTHEEEAGEFGETQTDHHIWLSPRRAAVMVQKIADELSGADSEHSEIYQQNAKSYIAELQALDKDIIQSLSTLKNRSFIVYHAAYGYFAKDYNLDMVTIEIEGKQANAKEMQQVIDYARKHGIKTVFYQQEFDPHQAETVAQEIDGKAQVVAPLSENYVESLRDIVKALTDADK